MVVVPVKRLDSAKTRLDRPDRADLALAMAEDTVAAAAACSLVVGVLVVSDDVRARERLTRLAEVIADEPDSGLNAALRHGASVAATRRPDCGVVALAADLPALRAEEIGRALTAAAVVPRSLVADQAGLGTVLLAAAPSAALEPRFGSGSRAMHRDAGVVDLTDRLSDQVPGLRRDVDTLADLAAADELGLGPRTSRLLAPRTLQATVRSWSAETGAGDAVTDEGVVLRFGPGSRLVGSLRRLRAGQRVRVTLAGTEAPTIGLVTES
jgi:2-phospho-L-lactate guanylyltransferase